MPSDLAAHLARSGLKLQMVGRRRSAYNDVDTANQAEQMCDYEHFWWFHDQFQFPSANANYPCAYCDCDNFFDESASKTFDQVQRRGAGGWIQKNMHQQEYERHPLFQVAGVCFWTLQLDLLRMVGLGVASHVFANRLVEVVKKWAGAWKARVGPLNKTHKKFTMNWTCLLA